MPLLQGRFCRLFIRSADTSMYHAKSHGCNPYRFFSQEMHAVAQKRLLLENDLRLVIERNEFIDNFGAGYCFSRSLTAKAKTWFVRHKQVEAAGGP